MDRPSTTTEPDDAAPEPDRLQLARRIEQITSLARQLRARLKGGPWRRRRRRARRQLARLAEALEAVQRAALTPGADVPGALAALLAPLEARLHEALYAAPSRDGLTALRRDLKATRRALASEG